MEQKFSSNVFSLPNNGKQIFYLSAGPSNGPLICFLHGWPGIAMTWKNQLQAFARLGFYVVAPDMPGYGQTWTSTDSSDYALEKIVPQCIDLLRHLGREEAIWFGHDWGCGPLWAIASHHPEVCTAVIAMSVPYRTLELGVNFLVSLVDRKLYPEDAFPYGQWDYQKFYEQDAQTRAGDRQFESNISDYIKLFFSKGSEKTGLSYARTSMVTKDGGWFGGPNVSPPQIPLSSTVLDEELLTELVSALTKTGFHGATSWYLNHAANEKYTRETSVNGGHLKMPVLFIHTEYDAVCQTVHNPSFMKEMRALAENLTEFTIKAGHWGLLECPEETNAGTVEWILKEVKGSWPGPDLKNEQSTPQRL
ncbi:uncharacterized protein A1O9_06038 [Exophiala aquamarina CBS 119918]|uniref:AB hydrolase-1 domain-containing protein n=1 Tax=Exophiala aquamarina CBS 119918 TaxID=1182545 RepID=A0A072PRF9_9EURO|nr:uncharacterized protein A1O9_06038 [Exophiala aquamarina CBS 119918]KEF58115.1 hypothetical protein A1O9_06038 [Exophiala aquamarina CBS 119918]